MVKREELEMQFIGTILVSPLECLPHILDLNPKVIGNKIYNWVFKIILKLIKEETPIDVLTICFKLNEVQKKNAVPFFEKCIEGALDPVLMPPLVEELQKTFNLDCISQNLVENHKSIDAGTLTIESYKNSQNQLLTELENSSQEPTKLVDIVVSVLNPDKPEESISTGYFKLDNYLLKLAPGRFIIIAGRPAMGKTALAMCIANNVSQDKKIVLIFSIEMSKEQLVVRLIAIVSGVDSTKIQTNTYSREEGILINRAANIISDYPLIIIDTATRLDELKSIYLKESLKNENISLIIMDHFGLMDRDILPGETDRTSIERTAREAKNWAKQINKPLIFVLQLSRASETRENKMPILSDLRDSGAWEQDGDQVIFVYRKNYYRKNKIDDDKEDETEAFIIVSKNKFGKIGYIKAIFHEETTKWEEKR